MSTSGVGQDESGQTSGVGQDESGHTSGVGQDESGEQKLVDRVHEYRSRLDRKGVTCHMSPSGVPFCYKIKSRIRETPTLSTNADSRTDTILERIGDFFLF